MKILFITFRFPHPPLKGDQVRSFNQIREFSRNNDVYLVSATKESVDEGSIRKVGKYCEEVKVVENSLVWTFISTAFDFFVRGRSINESYFYERKLERVAANIMQNVDIDVVHCCMIRTSQFEFQFSSVKTSIDFIDALSLNLDRKVEQSPWWKRWFWQMERRRVETLEREALDHFDFSFVTSEVDKRSLTSRKVQNDLTVVPNGVDLEKFKPPDSDDRSTRELIFTGNMSYAPNVKAVNYFVEEVFPLIREKFPDVCFRIAGAKPVRAVSKLEQIEGVEVLGFVDSIAECLQHATISVCPLRSGAGIQNKVLEAMATGTPLVVSSLAVEGIQGGEDGVHYLVGNGAKEFADRVNLLLADLDLREQLGEQARQFMEDNYSWKNQIKKMIRKMNNSV